MTERAKGALRLWVITLLFSGSFAHAGLVSVQNISINFPSVNYYSSGNFAINKTEGSADMQLYNAGSYDYLVQNAAFTFSATPLISDNSSAGFANALFAGLSTVTLSGNLKNKTNSSIIATGQLFSAEMVNASWTLSETSPTSSRIVGYADFAPTAGALFNGITDGANLIGIGNFRLSFSLVTPGISNFSGNYSAMAPHIQLSAAQVPEPITLLTLALGGFFAVRKNKF